MHIAYTLEMAVGKRYTSKKYNKVLVSLSLSLGFHSMPITTVSAWLWYCGAIIIALLIAGAKQGFS